VKVWKIRWVVYPNSAPNPSSAASSFFFSSSSFFFLSSGGAPVGLVSAGAAAVGAADIMVGAAFRASSMLTSLSEATSAFIWIGSAVTPAAVRTVVRASSFMGFPALWRSIAA